MLNLGSFVPNATVSASDDSDLSLLISASYWIALPVRSGIISVVHGAFGGNRIERVLPIAIGGTNVTASQPNVSGPQNFYATCRTQAVHLRNGKSHPTLSFRRIEQS